MDSLSEGVKVQCSRESMAKRITDKSIPDKLYKYRDWTDPYHKKTITHQEIYFPRPSEFNDPFDGNIPFRWDLMTYEDCVKKNAEILTLAKEYSNLEILLRDAKALTDEKKFYHPDNVSRETEEQIMKWDSIIGLFSLCEDPTNILMWSHYSRYHTGFVVGLNTNSLMTDYDFDYIDAVTYQTDYPTITIDNDTTERFYKKFFHKSEMWKYEKEWRISKNHIKNRIIKLNPETITDIIIGCNTGAKELKEIISEVRQYLGEKIPIFKAIREQDKFCIRIESIE